MQLRAATDADLDVIAEILAHYVTTTVISFDEEPRSLDAWRRLLAEVQERGLPFLAAEEEGTIAGYAYATAWKPKSGYRFTVEDTIYLAPGATGRGTGRLLLDALVRGCADAGMRRMIAVIADTGDPASVALHRACGFRDAGRLHRVGYKHGRWIDTVLMERGLGDGAPAP